MATVLGNDIKKRTSAVRKNIGEVFQSTIFDDRLTGRENLDLHGRLYGLAKTLRYTLMGETEIPIAICASVIVLFAMATIGLGGYMFQKATA